VALPTFAITTVVICSWCSVAAYQQPSSAAVVSTFHVPTCAFAGCWRVMSSSWPYISQVGRIFREGADGLPATSGVVAQKGTGYAPLWALVYVASPMCYRRATRA
jgi:hypothetical protein